MVTKKVSENNPRISLSSNVRERPSHETARGTYYERIEHYFV